MKRSLVKQEKRAGYLTTILPTIVGWIEQKYGYSPGVFSVATCCWSVSSTLEFGNLPVVLMIRCGTSSRLTHVTVVPAVTVSVFGANAKLSMPMLLAGSFGNVFLVAL